MMRQLVLHLSLQALRGIEIRRIGSDESFVTAPTDLFIAPNFGQFFKGDAFFFEQVGHAVQRVGGELLWKYRFQLFRPEDLRF